MNLPLSLLHYLVTVRTQQNNYHPIQALCVLRNEGFDTLCKKLPVVRLIPRINLTYIPF
jgi:hypothetical protein